MVSCKKQIVSTMSIKMPTSGNVPSRSQRQKFITALNFGLNKIFPFFPKINSQKDDDQSFHKECSPALTPLSEDNPSSTFFLKHLKAADVCIPYSEIIALPIQADFKTVINTFNACSHSRLPIYENSLDNILGMVYIKDVCKFFLKPKTFSLKKILRDVLFISPSLSLRDLFIEMQNLRKYMALVVDEFGGVDGLITINTVLHYIVGDIQDEDALKTLPQLIQKDSKTFIADARLPLDEIAKTIPLLSQMKMQKTDGVSTLGGLITSFLGYVPAQGELIQLPNHIELEVLEANPRHLSKLKIHLPMDVPSNPNP